MPNFCPGPYMNKHQKNNKTIKPKLDQINPKIKYSPVACSPITSLKNKTKSETLAVSSISAAAQKNQASPRTNAQQSRTTHVFHVPTANHEPRTVEIGGNIAKIKEILIFIILL
ncbi:hypothetical protein V6Z11_D05G227700 [Gossypium hirsutum]